MSIGMLETEYRESYHSYQKMALTKRVAMLTLRPKSHRILDIEYGVLLLFVYEGQLNMNIHFRIFLKEQ